MEAAPAVPIVDSECDISFGEAVSLCSVNLSLVFCADDGDARVELLPYVNLINS